MSFDRYRTWDLGPSSGVGERTPNKITDNDTSILGAQRNMRPKRIAAARGEMQRRQQIM